MSIGLMTVAGSMVSTTSKKKLKLDQTEKEGELNDGRRLDDFQRLRKIGKSRKTAKEK